MKTCKRKSNKSSSKTGQKDSDLLSAFVAFMLNPGICIDEFCLPILLSCKGRIQKALSYCNPVAFKIE